MLLAAGLIMTSVQYGRVAESDVLYTSYYNCVEEHTGNMFLTQGKSAYSDNENVHKRLWWGCTIAVWTEEYNYTNYITVSDHYTNCE